MDELPGTEDDILRFALQPKATPQDVDELEAVPVARGIEIEQLAGDDPLPGDLDIAFAGEELERHRGTFDALEGIPLTVDRQSLYHTISFVC
jgi:hypothetical protein